MRLAASPNAVWWLALVAFVESSVFPIPPDVLLIPMVVAAREKAWRYALVATAASVAGGWLGYAIGWFLFDQSGRGIITFYHLEAAFESFRAAFDQYGGWIVLLKGATPIPYKLVTIASGVAHLDPVVFTLASIGSRALRFFIVAALLWQFGAPIRDFVEKRLVLVTSAFVALLVGGYVVLKLAA
jgi:membrane protein YqaA with SNARE-associated domain